MAFDYMDFIHKHRELVRYVAFGLLTVLVSWGSYAGFVFLGIDLAISNIMSWICAVAFAFVVNKLFVFEVKDTSAMKLSTELVTFFSGRVFTGVVAALLFPALCAIGLGFVFLGVEGLFARGITSATEIVLNYFISKFLVFRKEKTGNTEKHPLVEKIPFLANMPQDLRMQLLKFSNIFVIAAAVFYTAFYLSGIASEVGTLYFGYAEQMVSGKMPYSGFSAEYPPLAMVIILLPRLMSFSSFTYQIAFGIEAYLFLLAGLYCVYRIAEKYTDRPSRYTDLYIIFTIIFLDFVLDRYDVFPMVMLLGSLYFFSREKYPAAWIMLAIGTMTKLYPALAAPLFLIWFIRRKQYTEAVKGVGICLAIGILCMLPFFIADSGTMFTFLTYHMDRGLQTEAPVSSVLMLLGSLGMIDVSYVFNYGSDNIFGTVPDAVAGYMLPIMIVCMLALYVFYAFVAKRQDIGKDSMPALFTAAFAAVMIFILVNKVLSSQYLVWMIPFMATFILMCEEKVRKNRTCMFIVAITLTQLNLIVNYAFRDAGEEFSLFGILILIVRNVLMFVILYWIVRRLSEELKPSCAEI